MRELHGRHETLMTAHKIKVADLVEYDVMWTGGVIVRIGDAPNPEYREVTIRRNSRSGEGYVDVYAWKKETFVNIFIYYMQG